jgi:hypothetical protein
MLRSMVTQPGAAVLAALLSVVIWCLVTAAVGAGDAKVHPVALGDSITREVRPGVAAEETFAALLEAELRPQKIEAEVVNVGVGGERTDQAPKRLDQGFCHREETQRHSNAGSMFSPKFPQIGFHTLLVQKQQEPQVFDLRLLLFSEGDGTRTRNHRIDSPVIGHFRGISAASFLRCNHRIFNNLR